MRLKEINPGMVIHCKNDEEKKELLEEAERLCYLWANGAKPTKAYLPSNTLVFREDGLKKYIYWTEDSENHTEFSDLILPELSAEEVFSIMSEIHNESYKKYSGCIGCCLSVVAQNCDTDCFAENADKIIEICAQWKSEHEKKEPEIEWVYRVFGAENYGEKFFFFFEEAIKRCEELAKSQKTKQYARYERVCRVKEV